MNWQGRSYDLMLGPLLRGPRRFITRRILKSRLFPVLDICCGTGEQCGNIVGQGGFAVGLDLDLSLLKYAASRRPQVPFVCADAAHLPFRPCAFRGVGLSFALHDKSPDTRKKMMAEARRVLTRKGRIIILDFENPWSWLSRVGHMVVSGIERLAGKEHFRNGRQFLVNGGLQAFLPEYGLRVLERRALEPASSSIVITVKTVTHI
jgi:ubiquinone/menaquinone biosynthesis C-methylase UbiE